MVHHKNGNTYDPIVAAARLNELSQLITNSHNLSLLFVFIMIASADVAVSDCNIYHHLTVIVV
jgi:hypothetical protein